MRVAPEISEPPADAALIAPDSIDPPTRNIGAARDAQGQRRLSRFRTAAPATCLAVVVACTPTPSVTGTPTTPSTPPPVPGFPDLSQFSPVDTQTYVISYPYFNGFGFTTPDGQDCGHNGMTSLDDPSQLMLSCEGPRPDQGPGPWENTVATNAPAAIEKAPPPLRLNPTYTPDPSMTPKPLPQCTG